ncbi:hypothetical protein GA0115240_16042 [Streptomyces sp. DvalAA-14]|nr:hypothetical protein GA0115240_16042 [Streptomyces sp. DvalAA-14]
MWTSETTSDRAHGWHTSGGRQQHHHHARADHAATSQALWAGRILMLSATVLVIAAAARANSRCERPTGAGPAQRSGSVTVMVLPTGPAPEGPSPVALRRGSTTTRWARR